MIRYLGALAQVHFCNEEHDQAFAVAQTGLRMIKQKLFAGLRTMEVYAAVAEIFCHFENGPHKSNSKRLCCDNLTKTNNTTVAGWGNQI